MFPSPRVRLAAWRNRFGVPIIASTLGGTFIQGLLLGQLTIIARAGLACLLFPAADRLWRRLLLRLHPVTVLRGGAARTGLRLSA